jgi:homoserine dehydrogenase
VNPDNPPRPGGLFLGGTAYTPARMRVILVGFGSVGQAFARLVEQRRESLYAAMGLSPRLVAVADTRGAAVAPGGLSADELLAAKASAGTVGASARGVPGWQPGDTAALIRETQADVVVEASPSVMANPAPAMANLMSALGSRKHAVSVNKAPLAVAMPALLELARYNRVQLRFSGTVGAGTPVLATARTLAQGDRILRVRAILNGTTNFILWRMSEQGEAYHAALAEAVRLGYAETDPSADVDGIDTCSKVVILANAVLGRRVTAGDVRVEGIRDIALERVRAARERGASVKMLGEFGVDGTLRVAPGEVPSRGPMDVPANLNAVQFTMETAGEVTLVGRGAGGPETGAAILRDLVDVWNTTPHA